MSKDWKAAIQPLINSGVIDRLPMAANIVLIIALTYTFAQLTWKVLPVPELNELLPVSDVTKSSTAGKKGEKTKQTSVSQLHLFGEAKVASETTKTQQVSKAPITRLNLTLRGVIASGSPDVAKAIIADSTGHENFYALGAKIPGGATLEEIHVNHVILKRNNRLETLQLPKEAPRGQTFKSRSRTSRSTARTVTSSANKDTGTLLREYRETLKTDPQQLMDLVRTQPYRENGRLVGYKIRPGKDRKLLRKFGLRSGDVVTAVNGVSLDNPIKGLEILRDLSTASQVSISIKRNGVAKNLSFQID